jgi:hypothetical protein
MWQRQQNDDEVANLKQRLATLEQSAQTSDNSTSAKTSLTNPVDNTLESTSPNPIIIFEPAGLFTDNIKNTITSKVLEPYALYASDEGTNVVAFHVQTAQVEGQYTVTAINSDESYSGFLIGGDYGFNWVPTCLDQCNFSDEFKAKYPDIVSSSAL